MSDEIFTQEMAEKAKLIIDAMVGSSVVELCLGNEFLQIPTDEGFMASEYIGLKRFVIEVKK